MSDDKPARKNGWHGIPEKAILERADCGNGWLGRAGLVGGCPNVKRRVEPIPESVDSIGKPRHAGEQHRTGPDRRKNQI